MVLAGLQDDAAVVTRHLIIRGVLLGIGFGICNLLSSLIAPLADDTIAALLLFYGPMFAIWGAIGFLAARKSGRIVDGIKAASIVAFLTFVVFDVMVILRVNVFLYTLTDRPDWRNLMARFRTSGSENLRAFITYHYVMQSPFKILVATAIGISTGVIGGLLSSAYPSTAEEAMKNG